MTKMAIKLLDDAGFLVSYSTVTPFWISNEISVAIVVDHTILECDRKSSAKWRIRASDISL